MKAQVKKTSNCGIQVLKIFDIVLLYFLSGSLFYLFYRQAMSEGIIYHSDLPAHITTALSGKGYSLISFLFRWIYDIWPSLKGIAFLLTFFIICTVIVTAVLIQKIVDEPKQYIWKVIPMSVGMIMVCNIWIPGLYPHFYSGELATFVTQPWHNSTYLFMRLLGVLVLILYFKIRAYYLNNITVRDAVLFTIILTLTNFAKPNFIIAFAPTMLIFLFVDFINSRGKKTPQIIAFGVCVLISLWILVIQARILYPTGGGSGVTVSLEKIEMLISSKKIILYFICGLAFPIVVSLVLAWKRVKYTILLEGWLMFIISWIERIFLAETGPRAADGNFGWGCRFFSFFLFVASAGIWIKLHKNKNITDKVYILGWIPCLLSWLCGGGYYVIILSGHTYLF